MQKILKYYSDCNVFPPRQRLRWISWKDEALESTDVQRHVRWRGGIFWKLERIYCFDFAHTFVNTSLTLWVDVISMSRQLINNLLHFVQAHVKKRDVSKGLGYFINFWSFKRIFINRVRPRYDQLQIWYDHDIVTSRALSPLWYWK